MRRVENAGMFIVMSIAIAIAICALQYAIVSVLNKNHDKNKDIPRFTSDFSVSEYLGRTEKTNTEIALEQEKQPKYQLVLWLVVDGLRLNEDGTTEWIQREEEKPKSMSASYQPPQQRLDFSMMQSTRSTMQALLYNSGCQNTASQIDQQIQTLHSQIQSRYIEQQQQAQYALLINMINQQQSYPRYHQYMPPTTGISQCYGGPF